MRPLDGTRAGAIFRDEVSCAEVVENDAAEGGGAGEYSGKEAVAAGVHGNRVTIIDVCAARLFGPEDVAGGVVLRHKNVSTIRAAAV